MPDLPKHVAIIMDGNGRWAKSRHLPRTAGHKKGVDATKAIVKHAGKIGIQYLTLYAFSTENWSRPDNEIRDLMGMLRHFLKNDALDLLKNNVCLDVIGSRDRLDDDIVEMIDDLRLKSANNDGLRLVIALNYGARQEIINAVNQAIAKGKHIESESDFERYLYTSDIPDPDVLVRTSGEIRLSNFLLWQCAYSEFVFSDILWPDFKPNDFDDCIAEFQNRNRRYGGIERE